jgi:hypothetical protein
MTTESTPPTQETTAAPRDGIAERGLSVNAERPTQPVSHEVAIAYINGGNPPERPAPATPSSPSVEPATSTAAATD